MGWAEGRAWKGVRFGVGEGWNKRIFRGLTEKRGQGQILGPSVGWCGRRMPWPTPPPSACRPSLLPHLTTLHGAAQVAQQAICHSHVVLAHGPVLEAPAFAIVVHKLCGLAREEQGFLIVLQGTQRGDKKGHTE